MTPLSTPRRNAYTLIEMLVVTAIIGVLAGMGLMGVQKAREAGSRIACVNNLKQLGLACHLHNDTFGRFPDGGEGWWLPRSITDGAPAIAGGQNWGWGYQILPFIEQQQLWANQDDGQVRAAVLPVFFCPSRRAPVAVQGCGQTDFVGNGGTDPGDYWTHGTGFDGAIVRRPDPTDPTRSQPVSPDMIPTGSSNLILLAEAYKNRTTLLQSEPDSDQGYSDGWDFDIIRWAAETPTRDANTDDFNRFGSAHAYGMNAVFCDGSVRTVSYNISLGAFQALCSRNP
jgi:prepilin-type N-terminal cleavage/methylation domain-containing protein